MAIRLLFVTVHVGIIWLTATWVQLGAAESSGFGALTEGRAASTALDPEKLVLLLKRLKSEYNKSGEDFDRKAQLIDWSVENGRPAMSTLRPLVQREGEARLAAYGQAFSRCIEGAKVCNREGVLAAHPELKTKRDNLIQFSEMAAKLLRQDARDQEKEQPHDFETFLAAREEAIIEMWKKRIGFGRLDNEEIAVVRETNRIRRERGLNPLTVDPSLCAAARDHSQDMVKLDFFSHESPVPDKRTFIDRARRFGGECGAENIALADDGMAAVELWMNSERHRANILDAHKRRIGVGRHKDHFTQMFGG